MKGSNSLAHRILPLVMVLVLLATALVSACSAPEEAAPAPSHEAPAPPSGAVAPPSYSAPAESSIGASGKGLPSSESRWWRDSGTIGLAVGGAKGIDNFRENISNGYLPLPTDITYEGLFYDYYFDTGQTKPCNKLFCPSYSYAVTRDPFSHRTEYYLSVGLNSGMEERDFERKNLNLVIVLDISGSMSSPFNEYYYDQFGNEVRLSIWERNRQKMEVAKDAVIAVLDQMDNDDRFGIVLFNERASLLQRMSLVRRTDMDEVADSIFEIRAGGSTNLADGMKLATDLLERYSDYDPYDYENRIIFLTDAMPNTGETGEYSLLSLLKNNSYDNIYTTFIGIGVDFNTQLVESITKTRGANYYSVHSPGDFMERMGEEFDYMVTPLVFDLRLTLEARDWDIEMVYGSPEADMATGELMKVNTLFPSKKEDGETKGGLILLKLRNRGDEGGSIRLDVSYEDRDGREDGSTARVYLDDERPEYFENNGIRKGILLARYADLMKDWLIDEREHAHWSRPWEPVVNPECGIVVPPSPLGDWERQSLPLLVSRQYRSLFEEFGDYFAYEMDEIGDATLDQELDILDSLIGYRD
jgi:Ca-activated chloride channel family protein